MSYCRYSSDKFKSDVYAYASTEGGYRIHVAARRVVDFGKENEKWIEIEHPLAGHDFKIETAEDFKKKLLELKRNGFHVPSSALKRIREEIKETKSL